jgi:hypothetical protein
MPRHVLTRYKNPLGTMWATSFSITHTAQLWGATNTIITHTEVFWAMIVCNLVDSPATLQGVTAQTPQHVLSLPYRPRRRSGNVTVSQRISVGSNPGRYSEVEVDFLTAWGKCQYTTSITLWFLRSKSYSAHRLSIMVAFWLLRVSYYPPPPPIFKIL